MTSTGSQVGLGTRDAIRGPCTAGWLVAALLLAAPPSSAAQRAGDCGGYWVRGATARVRVDVTTGLFVRRDAPVRIELPAPSAQPLAPGALPRASVFECLPGNPGHKGQLVPVRSVIFFEEDGSAVLAWSLSGVTPALSRRRYQVYVAPPAAAPLPGYAPVRGAPVRLAGSSVVPGGFEHAPSDDPLGAVGWFLTEDFPGGAGPAVRARRSAEAAHSGRWGLRIETRSGPSGAEPPSGPAANLADPVPVRGGVRYFLDAWVRIHEATGVGFNAEARFLRSDGTPLAQRIHLHTQPGEASGRWVHLHAWAVAPADASAVRIALGVWRAEAVVDVDDVALYPDPMAVRAPVHARVGRVERQASPPAPLVLERGATSMLFDFGPRGAPVAGGFVGATPDVFAEGSEPWGFVRTKRALEAGAGPRPDVLGGDFVDLGGQTFLVRAPEGPAVVWLHLGDYRAPGPGPWEVPALYRHEVTIRAGKASARLDPADWKFGEAHLSRHDDAVVVLRGGLEALYDTYPARRFADVFLEVDNRDEWLAVRCNPPGACPVAAMGVFSGVSVREVRAAVARFTERRRRAFALAWAWTASALPSVDARPAGLPPLARKTGFAPYALSPDADLTFGPPPAPAAFRAAQGGLRVRAARGALAVATLGLFPVAFRRRVDVDVAPLVDDVGRPLGEAPVVVRVERYRAVPSPRSREGQVALHGWELVAPDHLAMRPGIPRRLWFFVRVPADASPGLYAGQVRLRAGRKRQWVVPLSVEVLPFDLPRRVGPMQGVLGGTWAPDGNLVTWAHDLAAHSMDILAIDARPAARLDGKTLRVDWTPWDRTVAAARQGGMDVRAIVTQATVEPAFDLTGTPRVAADYRGSPEHRGRRDFPAAFDRIARKLLAEATAHARSAGWPPLFHYVAGEAASEGELGLAYEEHLLGLCRAVDGARCAASINGRASLARLASMDLVMPNYLVGFDQSTLRTLRGSRRHRQVWLYNTGGARYGRGLFAWALGFDGVVHEAYTRQSYEGDPFDPFDGTRPAPHYVESSHEGPVPTVRWERALLGVQDARYLAALQARVEKARRQAKAGSEPEAVQRARAFLASLRKRVEARVEARDIAWDGSLRPPASLRDLAGVRRQVIDFILAIDAAEDSPPRTAPQERK